MTEETVSFDETTYAPSPHEAEWLMQSLGPWFDDGTLADLLFAVRGGKEANVYCCRGGDRLDRRLVAAKVYRPRKLRELSNDAIYREGRALIDAQGHGVRARDRRMRRAITRGSRIGKRTAHTSWVRHEGRTLHTLFHAGADVPEPLAVGDNAVLMAFVGDEEGAAPTLDRVRPEPELAHALVQQALDNIEILLHCGLVHGDLSPYNLMFWNEGVVMIDLPQAAGILENPHGVRLFLRDVERIAAAKILGRSPLDWRAEADRIWDRVFDTGVGVPDGSIALSAPFAMPPRSGWVD